MIDLPKADLDRLLERWRAAAPGTTLPGRGDVRPEGELRPWLNDLVLAGVAAVDHAPLRFQAIRVGSRIVRADDRDITGMYLDEALPDRDPVEIHKPLETAVVTRHAVRNTIYGADGGFAVAQLVLPLAADGEVVDHLLIGFSVSGPANDQANVRRISERGDIQLLEEVAAGHAWRSAFAYIPRSAVAAG